MLLFGLEFYYCFNSTSSHLTFTYSESRFHGVYQGYPRFISRHRTAGASALLKYVTCVLVVHWLVSLYGSYSD